MGDNRRSRSVPATASLRYRSRTRIHDGKLPAKETADSEKLLATTATAISGGQALTKALRPSFREVSELLGKMDHLVLPFRATEPGARFAEALESRPHHPRPRRLRSGRA